MKQTNLTYKLTVKYPLTLQIHHACIKNIKQVVKKKENIYSLQDFLITA